MPHSATRKYRMYRPLGLLESGEIVAPLPEHPNQASPSKYKRENNLLVPYRPPNKPLPTIQPQHARKRQNAEIVHSPVLRSILAVPDAKLLRRADAVRGVEPDSPRVDVLHAVGVREEKGGLWGGGAAEGGEGFGGRGDVAGYRVNNGSEAVLEGW